ncbi:vWA domain-containing protein [Halomonas sp. M4R5S39]|uniref:vWA domain-containing protein n=1 Tax=Halomonas kalidii TaxID=3043293 RepID=UPI0024A7B2E8|nr:vWA domain-containing protein [Halomonas kalidii]MDI5987078.1 vWA domain-containing protein [Halomonas kalidii]
MAWWMVGRRGWRVRGLLVAAGLLCLAAGPSLAQEVEEQPDVRVIIDVSGSMKENDPNQLGTSALELLVSLLPDGVSAGVWTFGERVDNPLPLGRVDAEWRRRALALSPALGEYQQFTDIEAAVREAATPDPNGGRHLVLLTDGMIDLPPARGAKPGVDRASRQTLLDDLATRLAAEGVVVHGIAFSEEADLALVERLSQITAGLPAMVETPESLLGAFLDIFERIFPTDQVPLDEGRFIIDPDVESFSALLFHDPDGEPLSLIAPDGTVYRADDRPEGSHWQVEPRFDLIRIPEPQPGEWRLEGEVGDDSRISVVAPLTLNTESLPATLYLGFPLPLEAWLEREGEPLVEGVDEIVMSVQLYDPEGSVQAAVRLEEQEGRFVGVLPAPALTGSARLVLRAEGEDFHRQRIQAVNILPAIGARHEPRAGRVALVAEHPRLDRDNTELSGELSGETLAAEAVEERRWHMPLPELDDAISRPLLITARITLDGETRELRLPRLLLNPDASTGLDLADMAGPTLAAERFGEDLDPDLDAGAGEDLNAADRFVALVNALPRLAMELWQEGRPGLERLAESHGRDPRLWAGVVLAVVLMLVLLLVRRRRRWRRVARREEPHV